MRLVSKPEKDGSWLPGGVLGPRGPGHAFLEWLLQYGTLLP